MLGGYRLQQHGCVAALFEAKRGKLLESHFGELCAYHKCIQQGTCRGMLFGPASFQLLHTINASPIRLVKGDWTTPGSAEALRSFFAGVEEPPLLLLLRAVARSLDVQPIHVGGRCYLGSGASGHAFTVTTAGNTNSPRALKVVLSSDPSAVTTEFSLLEAASSRGAPVMRPMPGSLRTSVSAERGVMGSGYLLEAVGQPFRVDSIARCTSAIQSLAACHRAGVLHGDARLPNLLAVGSERAPAWIDLRTPTPMGVALEALHTCDMRTLARSIMALDGTQVALPSDVDAALARYEAGDDGSVTALAEAVWAAAPKWSRP